MGRPLSIILLLALFTGCGDSDGKKSEKNPVTPPAYSLETLMSSPRFTGNAFSPDEKKILYTSDASGIFNLYEIPVSGGSPKQLTHSTGESCYAISYFPEDSRILLRSDKGGNELFHLYVLDTSGKMTDLTPWENSRVEFLQWSFDKKSFYFLSNQRDPKYSDLYRLPVQTLKPELVFRNDEGFEIGPISKDDAFITLKRIRDRLTEELYLRNLRTRQMIHVSEILPPSRYEPVSFSNNHQFLYFLNDSEGEYMGLMRYNLDDHSISDVYTTNWDVISVKFSHSESYRAIAVNNDASTELRIIHQETGKPVQLEGLPPGDITSLQFSESEQWISFYHGSSASPRDLYSFNLETGNLFRLTSSLSPEIEPNTLVEGKIIRYASFDDVQIPAVYYEPLNATETEKVPAIVWVHGGPGGQSRLGFSALIQYLVNSGYAVIAVNNRGSQGYGKTFYALDDQNHGEGDLRDCIFAKNFLGSTGKIDTARTAILGGSYGGYMVLAAMAFEPGEFSAGVDIFGVSNWLRTLQSIPPWWESFRNALYKEMGNPEKDSVRLKRISPLFHAKNIRNPLMVIQGANDPRVLKVESDEIVAAVKRNEVPVEYIVFDDEGHGFNKKANRMKAWRGIRSFLDQYLKEEN